MKQPKHISPKGLLSAAKVLDRHARTASSLELLQYASRISPNSLDILEETFSLSQRSHRVDVASASFNELYSFYSNLPGNPAAERKLAGILKTHTSCLSILQRREAQPGAPVKPTPGKLLYLLNYALPQVSNGYTTRAQGLARGLKECGVEVHGMTRPGFPVDVGEKFTPSNTVEDIIYLHEAEPVLQRGIPLPKYMLGAAAAIERNIRKIRPQAVMAASNQNTALPALIAARRTGLPFWYEVRGFWEMSRLSKEPEVEWTFNYQFQKELDAMTAREADHVFTLTGPMREELVERGVSRDRISLLPNSVDPSRFLPRPVDRSLADELGIPEGVPIIGYVGSFVQYEGLQDLARACAVLRRNGLNFRLLLVGGDSATGKGPIACEIEKIAIQEGLEDWLIMPGRVPHEDVERYYSLIDITPFPRRAEKVTEIVSPLKPLEALAMGKAVAVPSLAVMSELVQHDRTGLIYEKNDTEALVTTLAKLIQDSDLRKRLGKAGQQWIKAERTWTKTAAGVRDALGIPDEKIPYTELLRKRGFMNATQLLYADIDLNLVDGSSIWMSSMASILAENTKTIVVSKVPIKRNTVVGNMVNRHNLLILTPENINGNGARMPMPDCIAFIRTLDRLLPKLQNVVIRGSAAAQELSSDRQFHGRIYPYLTDLYEHTDDGIVAKPGMPMIVDILARQSAALLVQTPQVENMMRGMTRFPLKAIPLPPPVPNELAAQKRPQRKPGPIRIGYAGKIAPQWGIQQLTSWTAKLRKEGVDIELTIIGDKIGGAATPEENERFKAEIQEAMIKAGAKQLGALERQEVFAQMQEMDFAWCWRPADFEEHTLELSTKLVEGVISGLPCITYPSAINRKTLGEDYGFFARSLEDFRCLLQIGATKVPQELRNKLQKVHGISELAGQLGQAMQPAPNRSTTQVCLATHDPKFIYPYFSSLKKKGIGGVYDAWRHAVPVNEEISRKHIMSSDIVLCEWGLGNMVWYSNNLPEGPKLVVRMHSQEVRTATQYGKSMNQERVDKFIFVTDWVRDKAISEFGIPLEKTCVIPNFIMEDEYVPVQKSFQGKIRLGMVGIVPQLKRLDRGVALLKALLEQGQDAELWIKGKRPEEYPWMLKTDRAPEMDYYRNIYAEIDNDPALKQAVHFEGWGNDVAKFYENIEHILSASDLESFHYAMADGILSGCHPVIWNWQDAGRIYNPDWVVENEKQAADRILAFRSRDAAAREAELKENRASLVSRYGSSNIYRALDKVLFD